MDVKFLELKTKAALIGAASILCAVMNTSASAQEAAPADCAPSGGLEYVCGITNPEDLVALPGGQWIVTSGMAPQSGLHLINVEARTGSRWIAEEGAVPRAPYGQCPSQPDADALEAHGISIRDHGDGTAALYVVNHGGADRETVEVFEIDLTADIPALAWIGCVPMPEQRLANAAVSAPDGTIYATEMLSPGDTIDDMWGQEPTGRVYKWQPGAAEFQPLSGTEMTGNNGLEISADGKTIYVVGMSEIASFSTSEPVARLQTGRIEDAIFDNIHWDGDRLLAAGSRLADCPPSGPGFDCISGYHLSHVDPDTLGITTVLTGDYTDSFKDLSSGLILNGTAWLGTFIGDRVAYRPLP